MADAVTHPTLDIDGLFGRLAVHLRLITLEQLAQATAQQSNETNLRPLGTILVERGFLEQSGVERVLKHQAEVMAVRRRAAQADIDAASARAASKPGPTFTQVMKPLDVPDDDQGIDVTLDGDTAPRAIAVNAQMARSYVETLLSSAVAQGASDVHVHSNERVRMRLHGKLHAITDRALPSSITEAGLLALLDADDQARLNADGHLDCALNIRGAGRVRANIYRQQHGLDGVFRIVKTLPPTLTQLGLKSDLARVTTFQQGIVLCTGPTGCGKTSTMAALVHMINEERAEHVVTIEDPIEVVHPSLRCIVSQRQVGKHTSAFARALKSALREDPDVIVIGEMRDRETVTLALTAAETGHLVLATLHTHSAVRTINRIIGEFPPQQQSTIRAMLSESLRAVLSQHLLPRRDGRGVVAAVEVLFNTPAVAHLIREGRTHQIKNVMQTGQAHGMLTRDDALKDLLARELIDVSEAAKLAEDPRLFLPGAYMTGRIDVNALAQLGGG